MKSKLIMLVLILSLVGCSGNSGIFSNKKKINIVPRTDTIKDLVLYEDPRFTIELPEGWVISTIGEYQHFGFRAYDPSVPSRSVFYYGTMTPWMKSEEAKNFWAWYAQSGYPGSQLYADAPVLYDPSIEGLYTSFNVFTDFAQKYGIQHDFPDLSTMELIESFPGPTEMGRYALDETMLRMNLDMEGIPIEMLATATLVDALSYPVNGIDAGYYTAYRVSGIMAPADDFIHHEERMNKILASFRYNEEYIQEGVRLTEWGTEQAMQLQKTLNATSKIIHDVWAYRDKVNDAANAEFITYLRGKTYLQDPDSGQLYEADNELVDQIMQNPDDFDVPKLEILPQGSPAYSQVISGVLKP